MQPSGKPFVLAFAAGVSHRGGLECPRIHPGRPVAVGSGPADLFATIFRLLGIDFTKRLMSPGNRPIDIVREGKVRSGLLA
jgi:hypothetical protein